MGLVREKEGRGVKVMMKRLGSCGAGEGERGMWGKQEDEKVGKLWGWRSRMRDEGCRQVGR